MWTLALKRCLTWDNIWKHFFQGPSKCVLCGTGEEESSYLFFRCPFSSQLWHSCWSVWKHPCVHISSLVDFWSRWGKPPTLVPFLQIVWNIGPSFILWQIWLERNRRIFQGESFVVSQVWYKIMGMIQEIVVEKFEVMFPLNREDVDIVERLGLKSLSMR